MTTHDYVPLPGSARTPLPNSRPVGPIDSSEVASLTVRTRSSMDFAQLERETKALYDVAHRERTYLTREEAAKRFGACEEDQDALEAFAKAHGLAVTHRSQAERSVVLTGALGDLLRAFPAEVQMFEHASGNYRGRSGDILIPRQFQDTITGIFGFDTRRKHKAPRLYRAADAETDMSNGAPANAFAKRYNFPTQHEGAALDGSGQCIAIVALGGGFTDSDLDQYFHEIRTPRPGVSVVSVDRAKNQPASPDSREIVMDIEIAGSIAPAAKIAAYFAPNLGSGLLDAVSAAVHDTVHRPSILSISWGAPEVTLAPQSIQALHEVFVAAAAMGVTVCAAAGDHGAADLDGAHWDGKIHVDHPAVDDFVLACGGTQFQGDEDVIWNDRTPFSDLPGGGGWAGGGGVSETTPLPDYQKTAGVPVSITSNKIGRGVPDIAMSAVDYLIRFQGEDIITGGASAVAPLMAGLVARLNQAKGKPVGFLNPFLYANAAKGVVKTVTQGSNAIGDGSVSSKTTPGYTAGPGWSACGGLGTPDGVAILTSL